MDSNIRCTVSKGPKPYTKYEVAKRLADLCFSLNVDKEFRLIAQLFIEYAVLPKEVTSYNRKELQNYAIRFLEEKGWK